MCFVSETNCSAALNVVVLVEARNLLKLLFTISCYYLHFYYFCSRYQHNSFEKFSSIPVDQIITLGLHSSLAYGMVKPEVGGLNPQQSNLKHFKIYNIHKQCCIVNSALK